MDYQEKPTLGVTDYVIFIFTLVACAAVGVYFRFTGKKQSTVSEIVVGDRNMPVIPVAFSIMATFCSAVGLVGVSAECYMHGFQMLYTIIGFFAGVFISTFLYHPVFYKMKIVTVNEYLEKRFGTATRKVSSGNFILLALLLSGFTMYASALAVTAMTKISLWTSVFVGSVICIFYCVLGGIKAVIWIDTMQAIIMFVTLIALVTKGVLDIGGFSNLWKIAREGGRTENVSFSFDPTEPYTFWSIVFGHIFAIMFYYGVNQAQVQRVISCKTMRQSKMAVILGVVLNVVIFILNATCGFVIFANFGTCEGIMETKHLKSVDQLFPFFAMTRLGHIPGLSGIVVSGLLSSALSTISSILNSLSAVTMEDFIKPIYSGGGISESQSVFIIKLLTFLYGGLIVLCTFAVEKMGTIFKALSTVLGSIAGAKLGLFTLGMVFQRPNQKGAIAGVVIAEALCVWLAIGKNIFADKGSGLDPPDHCVLINQTSWPDNSTIGNIILETHNSTETNNKYIFPLYKLSHMLFFATACVLTVSIGYLVSVLTGPSQFVPPELLSPLVRPSKQGLNKNETNGPQKGQLQSSKVCDKLGKQDTTKF